MDDCNSVSRRFSRKKRLSPSRALALYRSFQSSSVRRLWTLLYELLRRKRWLIRPVTIPPIGVRTPLCEFTAVLQPSNTSPVTRRHSAERIPTTRHPRWIRHCVVTGQQPTHRPKCYRTVLWLFFSTSLLFFVVVNHWTVYCISTTKLYKICLKSLSTRGRACWATLKAF